MSWSIKVIGPRAAVKAHVLADAHCPPGIKQTIADMCDDVTVSAHTSDGIRVETYGHFGGGYSVVVKLEVENVQILAPLPATDEPAPAPDAPVTN